MAKVFISYSRKDIEFAKRLTSELQKSEVDFWIDWRSIPPTVAWRKEIENGIEAADAFLFLISPDSSKSEVCRQEIEHAVKNGKRLVPLVISETSSKEVPTQLTPLNWIFFRQQDDFHASITNLLTSIHTDFEWVETQRRLQVKALEWERNHKENSFLVRGKDLQDAELQLATNSSKDPHPTDLQREYIFSSRNAADRQRRIITGISIAGIITLAFLAVFGFYQAGQATNNAKDAQNNAATAQANLVVAQTAQVDARNKQILADNNAATAVANEQEARRQAQIALARQIVAKAQLIDETRSAYQMVASLLAIQSMRLYPNKDAQQILMKNPGAHLISIKRFEGGVNSVAFSPDGKLAVAIVCNDSDPFITCGYTYTDYTIYIWEVGSGKELASMAQYDKRYKVFVAFSPDSKYVVVESDNAPFRVWETFTWKEISPTSDEFRKIVINKNNTVSLDGKYKYVVGYASDISIIDTDTDSEVAHVQHDSTMECVFCVEGNVIYVNSVAFTPDSKYLVSGSDDSTARVWELLTGKEIAVMTHDGPVESVAVSPDGKLIISGSLDGSARVWELPRSNKASADHRDFAYTDSRSNLLKGKYKLYNDSDRVLVADETGKEITHLFTGSDIFGQALFEVSLGDKYIVTSGSPIRLWDASTFKEIAHINSEYTDLGFGVTSDGKYVASGDLQGTIHIWDVVTTEEIATIAGAVFVETLHFPTINFTSDGKYVGVSKNDWWIWKPEDLLKIECMNIPRNLTRSEWNQYMGDAMPYQAVCPNLPIETEVTATPTNTR